MADAVTDANLDNAVKFVKDFAAKGAIVAVTGAIDLVSDGKTCYVIRNGRPEMGNITGTGCQLSGMMTAFVVANPTISSRPPPLPSAPWAWRARSAGAVCRTATATPPTGTALSTPSTTWTAQRWTGRKV